MRLIPYFTAGLLGAAGLIACASSGDATTAPSASNDIVGGVAADGHALDAVGAIMITQSDKTFTYCTGTLIAPRLVLTAKHCAVVLTPVPGADGAASTSTVRQVIIESPSVQMAFAIGPDSAHPTRTVGIDSVAMCVGPDQGGYGDFGCDVAVYRLREAITDIAPLPYALRTPGADLVGSQLTVVGYGIATQDRDAAATAPHVRNTGTATLRVVSGQPLHTVYASLQDAIDTWTSTNGGVAPTGDTLTKLQQRYDTSLLPDEEVFAGGMDGDAVNCAGDMGAPLLRNESGKLTVYGVAGALFGGGTSLMCSPRGAVYASLGIPVQNLITGELDNPCGDETVSGRCDGDVAVRCTKDSEGPRRVSKIDCSASLQHCLAPSDTRRDVACGD